MARRGYVQLANGFYLNRKVRRLRRTTRRQEAIWMEFNGITRGED